MNSKKTFCFRSIFNRQNFFSNIFLRFIFTNLLATRFDYNIRFMIAHNSQFHYITIICLYSNWKFCIYNNFKKRTNFAQKFRFWLIVFKNQFCETKCQRSNLFVCIKILKRESKSIRKYLNVIDRILTKSFLYHCIVKFDNNNIFDRI